MQKGLTTENVALSTLKITFGLENPFKPEELQFCSYGKTVIQMTNGYMTYPTVFPFSKKNS